MEQDPTGWFGIRGRIPWLDDPEGGLREITEHVRDVFWLRDPELTRMLYVSPAFENIWGRDIESLIDHPESFLEWLHPDDRGHVEASMKLQRRKNTDIEYRIRRPDGSIRWIRDRAFPIPDPSGSVVRIAGIAQDITAQRRVREDLEARERRYRALFEHSSELITVFDRNRKRLYFNQAARKVLDLGSIDPADRPLMDRVHPEDLARVEAALDTAIANPGAPSRVEYRQRRNNGSYGLFEGLMVSHLEVEEIQAIVMCARDVTDSRFIDPLTGLPNGNCLRHHLDFVWSQEDSDASRYSLVVVDLDRFGPITASLGEAQADVILVEVANRLASLVRQPSMLARLQGDRFAMALVGVSDPADALSFVGRMRAVFDAPFPSPVGPLNLSASFGVVVSPPSGSTAKDTIRSAEVALTRAKRAGLGRYELFDEALRKAALQRLELETALRRAIEGDELIVHYQPIFHLDSGRLAGFEALARWDRPGVGMTYPDSFIPVAEESELICELDMAVLRRAAEQVRDWRRRFPKLADLDISVNLSARHFDDDRLLGRIDETLGSTGVDPSMLKLEITEGILMSRPDAAAEMIRALQAKGFRLALDDFGTGYSSISYLHRFRFHALKIDRSFVAALGSSGGSPELVRAIIWMAHALQMRVIAEGVESDEHIAFLRDAECEFAQGYAFATPLTASAAEELLRLEQEA